MSNGKVVIIVVVGCLLLAVANVSLWATLDLFDPNRFGERVAEGLQTDAAAEALALPIVNRILENHPEVPQVARVPAVEVVTWLLQRPAFEKVFKETAGVANVVMTTSLEDVVGIDISGAASHVIGVVSGVAPELGDNLQATLDSAEEMGPLAIYEQGRTPKLREISNVVPWLWPLTALGAVALYVWAYWAAEKRRDALTFIGSGVIITAVVELLFVPAIRNSAVNNITAPNLREVINEVVTVLTRGLAIQSLLLIFIGIVVIVAGHYFIKEDDSAQASAPADTTADTTAAPSAQANV